MKALLVLGRLVVYLAGIESPSHEGMARVLLIHSELLGSDVSQALLARSRRKAGSLKDSCH